jgi:uncharacterized protein (DUF342 family)
MDDIHEKLRVLEIVQGIDDAHIEAVLSGTVPRELTPVAHTETVKNTITLCDGKKTSLEKAVKSLSSVAEALYMDKMDCRDTAIFVSSGEIALTIDLLRDKLNVFGKSLWSDDPRNLLEPEPSAFEVEEKEEYLEYRAQTTGYLLVRDTRVLTIEAPFQKSADGLYMEFPLLPLARGRENLYQFLRQEKEDFDTKYSLSADAFMDPESFAALIKKAPLRITAYEGRRKKDGADSRFDIVKESTHEPASPDAEKKVDMKSFTSYVEVQKDELIARKEKARPGIDGVEVDGTVTPAYHGKDIPLKTGAHVKTAEEEGRILYYAAETGVLRVKKDFIEVVEQLVIEGDAGVHSGNITYSKDVIVKGNLCDGYTIRCGRNLTIEGNVENGGSIHCAGNLFIGNGIFGDRTTVFAGKDCDVGFVQDSYVTVEQNLTVRNFSWQSRLFAGGTLTVSGNKERRGSTCVVGGELISMNNMYLNSVGSSSGKTWLYCGFNPRLKTKEKELAEYAAKLEKLITTMQKSMGINLHDTAALQRLHTFSPGKRQEIKTILAKLKEYMAKKEYIETGLQKLRNMIYSGDEKIGIYVKKDVLSDVSVTLLHDTRIIHNDISGVHFYYAKSGMKTRPYTEG